MASDAPPIAASGSTPPAPTSSGPTSSSTATPKSTTILWCHPRSASTMFECMLLTRQDEFRVLHEPAGETWYYSKERVSKRFSDEECEKSGHGELTFAKAWKDIAEPHPKLRTFSKDMAQYLIDLSLPLGTAASSFGDVPNTPTNPTLIPTPLLLQPHLTHTFLIRHPRKAVPSYARLCYPGSETGFEYFDKEEMGYKELRRLFDFVKQETGRTPLLIEAEELLKNPEETVEMWCKEVGIEFDESMLDWEDAAHGHFDKWPGFHNDAIASKGVGKQEQPSAGSSTTPHASGAKELSPELKEAVEFCMEDYEYLRQFSRKAPGASA
ncbi:hypothetical protein JCM10213_003672 [Rhodosporidiobolus nylandii]